MAYNEFSEFSVDRFGGPSGFYLNPVTFTATKKEAKQRRNREFEEWLEQIQFDDEARDAA